MVEQRPRKAFLAVAKKPWEKAPKRVAFFANAKKPWENRARRRLRVQVSPEASNFWCKQWQNSNFSQKESCIHCQKQQTKISADLFVFHKHIPKQDVDCYKHNC